VVGTALAAVVGSCVVVGLLPAGTTWPLLVCPELAVLAEVVGADVYGSTTV
jgi:hypothetical protein